MGKEEQDGVTETVEWKVVGEMEEEQSEMKGWRNHLEAAEDWGSERSERWRKGN